ncbi:uncharacterized protein MELLADRAFT_87486 [Melampsora larici-populina 98AG31]|uniref:PQ-loop-domain-containing protein n=1 Tax=Melampsora larici-populina (strain 98AG31 / pathotype 3-4-7) TaxID=747676 RepID=F4RNG6_MELLP|nr:uncharacterized protein MELLADRAFT_87486 [Melampsora larici-populina 98AG31]EGG06099.1 hypothetical protein MELLADRAFT_87486 [Melampsora larici-populina 98AG31]
MGWLSFACWLFVYSPQIYENYVNQSGDGISVYFILIWMAGDLANLFGSWRQNLLPTMIGLAVYYTICDVVILCQIFYYRRLAIIKANKSLNPAINPTETEPLLNTEQSTPVEASTPIKAEKTWMANVVSYIAAYSAIGVIGLIGWLISEGHVGRPGPTDPSIPVEGPLELWDTTAQIVGWFSAAAYLGSRIPQIFKNRQTKCKGLSLLFFLVGITGNTTYVASILLLSLNPSHLWINLSWLVGSAGTILLDLIVLYQFWLYRKDRLVVPNPVVLA